MPSSVTPKYQTLAAVDLGSNSFHMIVARVLDGHMQVIDRLREPVRLAGGMDSRGRLAGAAQQRALECLQRFGQRLSGLPKVRVRVVGTNTLRAAKNASSFQTRAEKALGYPLEIISGREEARLIHLGVAHGLADPEGARRLVVDIGGGSTELIIGEGFRTLERESLSMGCVVSSERYFDDGTISGKRMKAAETAALVELQNITEPYQKVGWNDVVGASGTIKAIRDIVEGAGWSAGGISADGLTRLRDELLGARNVFSMQLKGLTEDRAPILAGGVAILHAVFQALDIKHMSVSDMALREGLLYDMLGRISHKDVRAESVTALARLYGVDRNHVAQVAAVAESAFDQMAKRWALSPEHRNWLQWAVELHEVGLQIAHTSYHKHGAYIIEHSDLPGFSRTEQRALASLVRGHRRKFAVEQFETLSPDWVDPALRLALLIRLAVLLRRTRGKEPLPEIIWRGGPDSVSLRFPKGWLAHHPLTLADLQSERGRLADGGYRLTFR